MPHNLTVVARLVDGGEQDLYAAPDLLTRLARLQAEGFRGRHLIHELFTDDWGAPPNMIVIRGRDERGRPVDVVLEYD